MHSELKSLLRFWWPPVLLFCFVSTVLKISSYLCNEMIIVAHATCFITAQNYSIFTVIMVRPIKIPPLQISLFVLASFWFLLALINQSISAN